MKWVKDSTGRFPERPYYELGELDSLSEGLIVGFLRERRGSAVFPVSTEDLTVMVERHTSDLDQYADLDSEGDGVEGVTLFFPDRRPVVKISENLASADYLGHRLRTTLTHEFAHVRLHSLLWRFNQLRLLPQQSEDPGPRCRRGAILGAGRTDWMEWQAGYVSGAILMPITNLKQLVYTAFTEWGVFGSVSRSSSNGEELIRLASKRFDVSQDAARVRLTQLRFVV